MPTGAARITERQRRIDTSRQAAVDSSRGRQVPRDSHSATSHTSAANAVVNTKLNQAAARALRQA